MKIIFMGSAAFAVPSLESVSRSGHHVLEVITQPDKPAGRGMRLTPCPAALAAKELGLPLYQPKLLKKVDVTTHLATLAPDIIVVVAYGKILPKPILDIPPQRCINVHASLLPKYRGAAPINWAIVNGERETGVTIQKITEELDAGDVLTSVKTEIGADETAAELHDRLSKMGAELLLKTIDGIKDGTLRPVAQDHTKASFAPIIKKGDGRIDWTQPAVSIYNRIRGFTPWPGTFTTIGGRLLRIHRARPLDLDHKRGTGTIIESGKNLVVACGTGALYLLEVQPEGKRKMSAADFLHGHNVTEGTILE